jgi:aspartyl-tRNA synthetase
MYKTHTCGELRVNNIGEAVTLAGWVHRHRTHGGVTFIDLRDRFGIVQVVVNPSISPSAHIIAEEIRFEWVIQVKGVVCKRPEGLENLNLETGKIEIEVNAIEILNRSKQLPFIVNRDEETDESIRLKYRYLDLRRERMQRNLILRHEIVRFIRNYLSSKQFIEVETPILFKTTPEGARDYLVPSRLHPGEFYALPQSPQQLKQMLMVAGIEKYFQIARCFRDEDQRGDRQPEFTQLDIEMSFIERDDILALIEDLFTKMVREVVPDKRLYSTPWPRLTYTEAMDKYGKDNPDIRYGMELKNITNLVGHCGYQVFENVVAEGGSVRGINAKGLAIYSRKQIDELNEYVKQYKAKGLAYLTIGDDGEMRSSFTKYLSKEKVDELLHAFNADPGDLLLIVGDRSDIVFEALGRLRVMLAERLKLADPDVLAFCWVIDFPFVNWNEEENRWDPSHHLFTAPVTEDIPLLVTHPEKVRGQQYDLVLNNYEVGGGSIRIHDRGLQERVFTLIGLDKEVAKERFGHMLDAFEYGTPPHGGIAPGIDRICMILAGEPNIREVIAFPKNQAARDLMSSAPSEVDANQLRELQIQFVGNHSENHGRGLNG